MNEIANLPHNADIERVVLSTLLAFGDLVRRVDLPSEVFHLPRHKQAYELMLEMVEDGDPVTYVSFKAKLEDRGTSPKKAKEFVLELTDPLPSTKHFFWYAEKLRRSRVTTEPKAKKETRVPNTGGVLGMSQSVLI